MDVACLKRFEKTIWRTRVKYLERSLVACKSEHDEVEVRKVQKSQ